MSTLDARRERLRRIVVCVTKEVFTAAVRVDRGRDPSPIILDAVLLSASRCADDMEFPEGFDEASDTQVYAAFETELTRKLAMTRPS